MSSLAKQEPLIPEAVPEKENGSVGLMKIIQQAALDPTFDAAKLAVLLDVKLKWEADEARKQFWEAYELFKRNLPQIEKTKHVSFPTSGGGRTEYKHAELDKITPILTEALLAVGITHSWRPSDTNGKTTVTCVFRGFGHSEDMATLSGPPDTSGGKNNVQAIGSTNYYLQRYTFLAACGIAPKGCDDDGKTIGMSGQAIQEYCETIKDATTEQECVAKFQKAYTIARDAQDDAAMDTFIKVKDATKREIRARGGK